MTVIFSSQPLQYSTTAWPGTEHLSSFLSGTKIFLSRVFMWPYDIHSELYTYVFPKFLYPINNIIFNFSIGLTVVVAFERLDWEVPLSLITLVCSVRYNAVCRPHYFHYRTVVSHSLTSLTTYVLPVVILSTLLNIPKFFETEFVSFKQYFVK